VLKSKYANEGRPLNDGELLGAIAVESERADTALRKAAAAHTEQKAQKDTAELCLDKIRKIASDRAAGRPTFVLLDGTTTPEPPDGQGEIEWPERKAQGKKGARAPRVIDTTLAPTGAVKSPEGDKPALPEKGSAKPGGKAPKAPKAPKGGRGTRRKGRDGTPADETTPTA
jgi:hypothetical protein